MCVDVYLGAKCFCNSCVVSFIIFILCELVEDPWCVQYETHRERGGWNVT